MERKLHLLDLIRGKRDDQSLSRDEQDEAMGPLAGAAALVIAAHKRKWLWPLIFTLSAIQLGLSVVPWTLAI